MSVTEVAKLLKTATHVAIAELARHVPRLTVVTQNVDNLHERAGSQAVIHLHGSLHSPRCIDCGVAHEASLSTDVLPEAGVRIEPPRCTMCEGLVRPGVVWFGEMLPEHPWSDALAAAQACDLFVSIGTSGVGYPAAELPLRAHGKGATVVHVNPDRVEVRNQAFFLEGKASDVMTALVNEAFGAPLFPRS